MKTGWRVWAAVAGMLLLGRLDWGQTGAGGNYQDAGIARMGDIAYPVNSSTTGIVTLDVNVDATGEIQNLGVVRDVPPLTAAAQSAIMSWKFTPAGVSGHPAGGTARVHVVFNPYNPSGVGLPGAPLQPAASKAGAANGDFVPADVKTASYATYPGNTVTAGTVVLELRVGPEGTVDGLRVRRGLGKLAGPVTRAVKNWTFVPARYKGSPVASAAFVAFVFAPPAAGTM
jgi:hypothetical protein